MHPSQRRVAISALLTLSLLVAIAPVQAEEQPAPLIPNLKAGGDPITRDNGEIRVPQGTVWVTENDTVYPINLEFPDRTHYMATIEGDKKSITIDDLVALVVRTEDGVITVEAEDILDSLGKLPELSAGPLAKDVIARAIAKVGDDQYVLVSFGGKLISGSSPAKHDADHELVGDDTNIWPCQNNCSGDIFNECDSFAIGGCGGPGCTNACKDPDTCEVTIDQRSCIVYEVPFGFDLCICG